MSRYMVNKLMWEVDRTDAALAAFKTDPDRFIDSWEAAAGNALPPYPLGGRLSDEERVAVVTLDFGALYAMGVNPFVLWQFARSVMVPDRMSNETLVVRFREAVEPHGYPEFTT